MKNYCCISAILFIFVTSCIPALAMDIKKDKIEKVFKQTSGVIAGAVVNPLIGFVRGGICGWTQGTRQTAKSFGDEDLITYKIAGGLTYGLIKGTAGAIIGIFRAEGNAFKFGVSSPWTKENFCLSGNNFLDYDPFGID
ncbi:MAG: hypothetical protein HY094_01500 [Candidatus Melainabacteria bacterium]|nr:hypothetical protein [Candidatus Melainabacteria bacterium]